MKSIGTCVTALFLMCSLSSCDRNSAKTGIQQSNQRLEQIALSGDEATLRLGKDILGDPSDDDRGGALLREAEINARNFSLLGAKLPPYVLKLRGRSYQEPESNALAEWGFIVPKERAREFNQYLLEIGVPDEAATRQYFNGGFIPDFRGLQYIRTTPIVTTGVYSGLQFEAGESFAYEFSNADFYIYMYYSPKLGSALIGVDRISR